jgi:LPXTG-site transpeptidase (sortase) family protein
MKLPKSIAGIKILIVTSLLAVIFFLVLIFILNSSKHTKDKPKLPDAEIAIPSEEISMGIPKRLKIPNIEVDADILSVGLAADGSMDTPKEPAEVAWFNLGEKPGDLGSAVITGHYGTWKNGSKSVFDNLNKLKKGDKVYIEDDKGDTISFVVREIRSYDPTADATDVFSSDDDLSHLNLITCEGTWNETAKSFSKRLVVFTDKE